MSDDLVARLLVLGLAVDACRRPRRRTCGACGRPPRSRRPGRRARTCCAASRAPARARRSSRRRGRARARAAVARAQVIAGAVERLGAARAGRRGVPRTVHFSGSTTSSRAGGRGRATCRPPPRGWRSRRRRRVELDGGCAHPSRLTDQSTIAARAWIPGAAIVDAAPGAADCRCRRAAMPLRAAGARSSAGATSASSATS